jgi:hypothetical protein
MKRVERPKRRRKLGWIIALVAAVVVLGLVLLVAWWYSDLLLKYD